MINGKKCTIVWYVDDNKISHEDPKVVNQVLKKMKEYFGNITVTRGKEHQFLGINFKIRDDQKVELHAKDQILGAIKMIEDLGEVIDDTVLYPAGKNLQYVNEDTPKLSSK